MSPLSSSSSSPPPPTQLPPPLPLPSLSSLALPLPTFRAQQQPPNHYPEHLAMGARIIIPSRFSPTSSAASSRTPKLLILRRDPRDSNPLRWEAPGGGVDSSDGSVLAALSREVLEETGLRVSRVRAVVDYWEWEARWTWWRWGPGEGWWVDDLWALLFGWDEKRVGKRKRRIRGKLTFLVEVEDGDGNGNGNDGSDDASPAVKLAKGEHVEFQWVEEDVIEEVMSGRRGDMEFTSREELRSLTKGFQCWKELNARA